MQLPRTATLAGAPPQLALSVHIRCNFQSLASICRAAAELAKQEAAKKKAAAAAKAKCASRTHICIEMALRVGSLQSSQIAALCHSSGTVRALTFVRRVRTGLPRAYLVGMCSGSLVGSSSSAVASTVRRLPTEGFLSAHL